MVNPFYFFFCKLRYFFCLNLISMRALFGHQVICRNRCIFLDCFFLSDVISPDSFPLAHFTFLLDCVHPLQGASLHQSSIAFCLLLSCSRWFPPSLLCRLAIFCMVVLLISSLSLVATLCSVWSTYCPLVLLYVQPISTFVSVCIL